MDKARYILFDIFPRIFQKYWAWILGTILPWWGAVIGIAPFYPGSGANMILYWAFIVVPCVSLVFLVFNIWYEFRLGFLSTKTIPETKCAVSNGQLEHPTLCIVSLTNNSQLSEFGNAHIEIESIEKLNIDTYRKNENGMPINLGNRIFQEGYGFSDEKTNTIGKNRTAYIKIAEVDQNNRIHFFTSDNYTLPDYESFWAETLNDGLQYMIYRIKGNIAGVAKDRKVYPQPFLKHLVYWRSELALI